MSEAICQDESSEKHSICGFPHSTQVTHPCHKHTQSKKGWWVKKIIRTVKFNTQVPGLYWLLADRPQSIA